MSVSVQASYDYCRRVARSRAKNFYYSFLLLDADRRNAMCAIYAFMRYCDDLSDDVTGTTPAVMDEWRRDLVEALNGRFTSHAVWPAFHDTVTRYKIPHQYFHEMIDGVSSDLKPQRLETFNELYQYCYRVASVVGLTIIHIFGFSDPKALVLAEKCGIAFQLTNIIRDVREDAEMGRVYIPLEDWRAHGVDPSALKPSKALTSLLKQQGHRARAYYTESAPLINMVSRETRRSLWALIEIYSQLLIRIEQHNYAVLTERIRLSTLEKLTILARALLRR